MVRREPAAHLADRRRLVVAAGAVVLAALWLSTAAARAGGVGEGHTARFEGCHDQFSTFSVPRDRAQIRDGDPGNDRVPEDYTIRPALHEKDGTAVLGITILRCSVTVAGTFLPSVTLAYAGLEIEPPEKAEHLKSDITGDYYLRFIASDSKRLADWLRAGTGLEVHHVSLAYSYTVPEPFGVAPFSFESLAGPDWAFKVEGAAVSQMQEPAALFIDDNYWRDTKETNGKTSTVRLTAPSHADYIAPATVAVTATPGSELHDTIAPEGWPDDQPYSGAPTAAFSVRQGPWEMTKTVLRK